jgi:pimeloyl-ACP methyl ester carboxylesterase
MNVHTVVRAGAVTIQVAVYGEGETVVLLPGNGRGTEDFDDLSQRLVRAGYRAVLPQSRGIARVVATDHPTLVQQVILVAAGGMIPPSPETQEAIRRASETGLAREERLAALRRAYFATGNDPGPWESGWHIPVSNAQRAANSATPVQAWWAGGSAPMLVLQGAEDASAPPENARRLLEAYGARITVVEIPGAGHAMLPEQPERIASEILRYLQR